LLLLTFSLPTHAATKKVKLTKALITQINDFTLTATKGSKTYIINAQRAKLRNAKNKTATLDQLFIGDQIDVSGTMGTDGILLAKTLKDRSLKETSLTRGSVSSENLASGAISSLDLISNGVITGDKIQNATITGANLATDLSVDTTGQINASGLCLSGDCKTAWDQITGSGGGWIENGNDIYNSNSGNVGIGTDSPGYPLTVDGDARVAGANFIGNGELYGFFNPDGVRLHIDHNYTQEINDTNRPFGGIFSFINLKPSSVDTLYPQGEGIGNFLSIDSGDATNWASVRVFNGYVDHYGSGTIAKAHGIDAEVYNEASGSIIDARGVVTTIYNFGAGTIANAYGFAAIDNSGSTGPVNNAYGLYIDSNFSVTATNKWGVYEAGSNYKNYFAGNVGIGTTSPAVKLDVNGEMKLKKNSAQPYACDAAHDAAVAVTNKYTTCICKNGTGWVLTADGTTGCTWN
jgi:hypothetical protein